MNNLNINIINFYTDGALDRIDLTGSVSWVKIDKPADIEKSHFNMKIIGKKSSTRLEILAIIMALLVVPENFIVNIYTNSQAAVLKWNRLQSKIVNMSERKMLDENDIYLWKWINKFIGDNNITMNLFKVKAHDKNKWNDRA